MARRIKKADIQFVSLCPKGMNGLRTLYKSADSPTSGEMTFHTAIKELSNFEEKGQLAAIVWPPNRLDKEGDWADADTVKQMAHSFAKNGMKVDLRHDNKALNKEDVYVAESFIVQKGDSRFEGISDYDGEVIDPTGSWGMILQIDSPALRKAYRNGEWQGVSMAGPAVVELDSTPPMQKELKKMDKEEVKALVKGITDAFTASIAAMGTEIVKALKPAEKKEEAAPTKKAEAIPFPEGFDPRNPEHVQKHLELVEAANVNWDDPIAVAKHLEKVLKRSKKDVPPSNAGTSASDTVSKEEKSKIEKELEEGSEIAKILNKRRGFSVEKK